MPNGSYKVMYCKYDCEQQYKKDFLSPALSISVSKADLIRHSISLGSFSGMQLSDAGVDFYKALANGLLHENSELNCFQLSDDYLNAESTIRNVLSFFLGMIAAKVVAERVYKIWALFHLKDSILDTRLISGKSCPDFFGVSIAKKSAAFSNEPFLIEAKGSINNGPNFSVVQKAVLQLSNVESVRFVSSSTKYSGFEKHVIASGCLRDAECQPVIHDIDPTGLGKLDLWFDANHAINLYYAPVLSLVRDNGGLSNASADDYVTAAVGDYEIGLHRKVFELLTRETNVEDGAWLFRRLTDICASEFPYANEGKMSDGASYGLDGIMVRQVE